MDLTDLAEAERVIRWSHPQIVWVETPSNPFLLVTDIAAIAALTHEVGGLLIVDNTFATPVLQRPRAGCGRRRALVSTWAATPM